ncbi:molybdate ABC transporter substrate-binding protein [Moraxella osloensis]|nr:molybdate ABC transporter substrate-binding protein [Moraxella osloensis]OBX58376.1 molybdate ABC transporter substrate-binding protein [Moraxella osloensis]
MTFNQPASIFFNRVLFIVTAFIAGCNSSNSNQNSTTSNNQSAKEPAKAISKNAPAASSPKVIENLHIAAFSNLRMVLPILVSDFNHNYPNIKIQITFAPNTVLYNTVNANPQNFDIYLSGNQSYPKLMLASVKGVKSSPFTYTRGQLVLYSHKYPMDISPTTTLDQLMLDNKSFSLAIANPENLAYGVAAEAWLVNQNLYNNIKPKIIYTNTLDETFALTDSGKADFGFVSLSQVLNKPNNIALQNVNTLTNNYLILPKDSYPPILQDGIILNHLETSQIFVDYLKSAKAQDVLTDAGFLPICTSTTILPACK